MGLEWDPSHLVCQLIDPVANLRKFGSRVFHVHVKDAYINRPVLDTYGICHPGVAEHRVAGFGQVDWAEVVHLLTRIGYDSDLTVEGWHAPVFRDHAASDAAPGTSEPDPLAGQLLEETGLALARQTLERFLIKS